MRQAAHRPSSDERGVSMLETLVALSLGLLVMLGTYDFIDSSRKAYAGGTELSSAQSSGRAAIELLSWDIRQAGYSPLGVEFDAVPTGDPFSLRIQADLNGDGVLTTGGENLIYSFMPQSGGLYNLVRGVDLNLDGDAFDSGETQDVLVENVVPVDLDGDGTDDDFFSYALPPPFTNRVGVAFGVRTAKRDLQRRAFPVVSFRTEIELRNLTW